MLAPLFAFAVMAAAGLALCTIAASLAQGLAAASSLRQQLDLCGDTRMVVVRQERDARARWAVAGRTASLPIRPSAPFRSRLPTRAAA